MRKRIFLFVVFVSSVVSSTVSIFLYKKDQEKIKTVEVEDTTKIVETTQETQVLGETVVYQEEPKEVTKKEETQEVVDREIKVGIVVDDYQNKFGTIPTLQEKLENNISTVSIFKQFGQTYNKDIVFDDLNYIKSSGKNLMITWEPWNPEEGLNQSKNYLTEILTGQHDAYINKFAQDIKTYGSPVRLRFAHEMNGNWYPWGNRPAEYRQAYVYIYNKFKEHNVSNVTWVWSPNAESVPTAPVSKLSDYYPGDEYVDIIGLDGFNFGNTQANSSWKTFDQIFSAPYKYLSQKYLKPVIIAETASSELGGNKSEWIKNTFITIKTNYPKVIEIVWFNLLKETDWRIESTDSSLSSFKSSI